MLVDNDRSALSKVSNKMFSHKKRIGRYNTRLFTKHMDLNKPYLDNIRKFGMIPKEGVPSIMCNFAIHYFLATKSSTRNFINLVSALHGDSVKQKGGGTFMFVGLNGRKVFDLLKDKCEGESVDFTDGPLVKFSIKRMYASDQFMEVGQKIGMLLPFSDEIGRAHV